MNLRHVFFIAFGLLLCWASGVASEPMGSEHVAVELVSEVTSVQPGTPLWLALRIEMEEDWHTYWINPGDAGLPTKIDWQLPEGFLAGPIEWPYPIRVKTPPLESFGYEGEVFLLTKILVPEEIQTGMGVNFSAAVEWLECKDICIPGAAELSLELPGRKSKWTRIFPSSLKT